MSSILAEWKEEFVVQEMVKVKAHLTLAQAEAAGEGKLHAGNDKADQEAGRAAGAVDTKERVAYMKGLDKKVLWLRQVARALHKQEWADVKNVGKRKSGEVHVAQGSKRQHQIEWRGSSNAWACTVCGRLARGGKAKAAVSLGKRACEGEGILGGIDQEHQISTGWTNGALVLAFCTKRGRYRSSKGKGLKGRCDTARAQKTRLDRVREGRHPVLGTKFEEIRTGRGQSSGVKGNWLVGNNPLANFLKRQSTITAAGWERGLASMTKKASSLKKATTTGRGLFKQ